MKKQKKEGRRTAHLILEPYRGIDSLSEQEKAIAQGFEALPQKTEDDGYYRMLTVREKKSGRLCGAVLCSKAEKEGTAEINLQLYAAENGEKTACEVIRGATKCFFASNRGLMSIETWLNPDLGAIRILEKAGFERVFERGGVVRYEKKRPHFPALAASMALSAAGGILAGALTGNYPLCMVVGIAAGILPGALIERALVKKRG